MSTYSPAILRLPSASLPATLAAAGSLANRVWLALLVLVVRALPSTGAHGASALTRALVPARAKHARSPLMLRQATQAVSARPVVRPVSATGTVSAARAELLTGAVRAPQTGQSDPRRRLKLRDLVLPAVLLAEFLVGVGIGYFT